MSVDALRKALDLAVIEVLRTAPGSWEEALHRANVDVLRDAAAYAERHQARYDNGEAKIPLDRVHQHRTAMKVANVYLHRAYQ